MKKFDQIEYLENKKEELKFQIDNEEDWEILDQLTNEYIAIDKQLTELTSHGEGKKLYQKWYQEHQPKFN